MAVTEIMMEGLRDRAGAAAESLSDADLRDRITAAGEDLDVAAAQLWREFAAATAALVNVSESGSSRSLGDTHKNALTMASHYDELVQKAATAATAGRSRTRAIQRA